MLSVQKRQFTNLFLCWLSLQKKYVVKDCIPESKKKKPSLTFFSTLFFLEYLRFFLFFLFEIIFTLQKQDI